MDHSLGSKHLGSKGNKGIIWYNHSDITTLVLLGQPAFLARFEVYPCPPGSSFSRGRQCYPLDPIYPFDSAIQHNFELSGPGSLLQDLEFPVIERLTCIT